MQFMLVIHDQMHFPWLLLQDLFRSFTRYSGEMERERFYSLVCLANDCCSSEVIQFNPLVVKYDSQLWIKSSRTAERKLLTLNIFVVGELDIGNELLLCV